MRHIRLCITLLLTATALLFTAGCGGDDAATGSIAGFVVDANTGEPVRNASITINPGGYTSISGSDGRYEYLNLKADTYTVQASKSGYITNTKTVVVPAGGVGSGDIMLTPSSGEMSLSVSYIDFGSSLTVASFQIHNNAANGSFQWSVAKESPADWLTVSPTSGSCGAGQSSPVSLTVNRALVATSQTVTLRVTNTTSGNSIALPVSVSYNSGALQVTPNPVDFGTSALTRQMTILNTGSSSVNYEVNYNCAWLTVSPTSGTLYGGASATLSLALDRSAFTGSAQTVLQVRNTADGSVVNVSVTATNDGGGGGGTVVVPGGLQCYYTFDNGTANDMTDNSIDAQLMNSASIVSTGGGAYLKLSHVTDDYLNIPYNLFQGLSNWSVCFWIKDFGAGNLFGAISSSGFTSDHPICWADQNNKLRLKCGGYGDLTDGGTAFSYNYTPIQSDGSWHHIVVSMSGKNIAKLYVDGSLRDQISIGPYWEDGATKVVFGGSKDGAYAFSSSMKLDNIRFYNRTLTNAEVQTIYNNEL